MKRVFSTLALGLCCGAALLLSGCLEDTTRYTYIEYEPQYLSWDELRAGVKNGDGQDLKEPGKIWVYNNYLLINEYGKGIHIIDNSNPSSPDNVAFITIPGNVDMAVKDGILYADSYVDLVAIELNDPRNAREVGRVESIFPYPMLNSGAPIDPERGVIIGWEEVEVTSDEPRNRGWWFEDGPILADDNMNRPSRANAESSSQPNLSLGGSMARFTIINGYLYTLDLSDMQIFTLSDPLNPSPWAKVNVGWQIETIFPYKDKLFIGSQTGMFIFDNSNPANPQLVSEFSHAMSCDPVVADDNYAYVTLRTGTRCNRGQNQLDIIDIRNVHEPKLVKTYLMQNPHGLGVVDNTLYICDGEAGLKVFDASDKNDIRIQSHVPGFKTFDIIPLGALAIVVGPDGLYQYDTRDADNVVEISKIPIRS